MSAALVAAAAGFDIPVDVDVLLGVVDGATAADVARARVAGHLVAEEGGLRPNPLADAGDPVEPQRCETALRAWANGQPQVAEQVWVELARLCVATGARPHDDLRRAVDAALLGGTAQEISQQLLDARLLRAAIEASRLRALRLLIEGNRHEDVRPVLTEADSALRARLRLREGHPADALEILGDADGNEAALVRADAFLGLGQPREALAAVPAAAWPDTADDVTRRLLRSRALLELGDEKGSTRELDGLEALANERSEPRIRLHLFLGRALQALRRSHLDTAAAALEDLARVLDQVPGGRIRGTFEYIDAMVSFYQGNHARLAAQLRHQADLGGDSTAVWKRARALVAMTKSDLDGARGILTELVENREYGVVTMLAHLDLLQGNPDGAEAWLLRGKANSAVHQDEERLFERMIARQRGTDVPSAAVSANAWITVGHLLQSGLVDLDVGDLPTARQHADTATDLVTAHGLWGIAPETWLLRADIEARSGNRDAAIALLDRAEARLTHPDAPPSRLIAAARHALSGTLVDDETLLAWAALRDHAAVCVASRGRAVPMRVDAFLHDLPQSLRRRQALAFPSAPPAAALQVEVDGRRFCPPGGSWVDLGRSRAQRRILDHLTGRRLAGDSSAVGIDGLFAAGWPGEQALPDAAKNRVHVTLSKLRASGLAELLQTTADGWRLDPAVPVLRVKGSG